MKIRIRISKRFLVFFLVFLLGVGTGVGGIFLKDTYFPSEERAETKKNETIGPLIELEEFLVNLDGGGMLKTEIAIEGKNSKSESKIRAKEAFLRDRILSVLSSKGISDVRSPEGREKLKQDLITNLNEVCPNEINDVLFRSFIYTS